MGVNLKDIIPSKRIGYGDLSGKTIAVDALNTIYQFLSSIRQHDGTPLMDSQGNVTSHLSGLLYRTTNLARLGVKPIYVFDGKPPDLKYKTLKARGERKREAEREWTKAKEEGRFDDALKYAKRTSKLTDGMLDESKELLDRMGVPYVQAPSEGEAQCTRMVLDGEAWAVGSQDYDALLFGAPRIVRGLTMSGKFELSLIELEDALAGLGISREQLVDLAILVGTDFNEGIHGIGPKKALKAVLEGRVGEFEDEVGFEEVREVFLEHPTTDDYEISWKAIDTDGLVELLSNRHEFSIDRVKRAASELEKAYKENSQQSLNQWF
ncbi:MAG: flap endonuclease-1 [Candidatus Altiarchaeales archaeon]|nr:flap endonuclease-1 [Candidatus Altiarchaeales archaeon]MBD3415708.1 flap endonuclease-1 [Candidatus Altiarchaeales archaeon]